MFTKKTPTEESAPVTPSLLVRIFGPVIGGVLLFGLEIIQIVVIAAAIIIPIRYFLVQPFYVRGASMEPTFEDREYLLIDEVSYRFHEPERGDVIVFRYPRDKTQFFIKRIIGLPGDTVRVQDGKVTVIDSAHTNGVVLQETYVSQPVTLGSEYVTLNPDEYFVLGDNRPASMDSRSFGPIKSEHIVGRVWLRGLPLDRFSIFETPTYEALTE
ncbi:signal peptidase I [Candidatus Uhrbacteria bacterium CG10_big_fil_rev_8_21_14_0_10_50_16]|uniref:Signal peptidase I n=1 Tax=Candidatus Uhrbacteria bacterium CG10_big_fil_rev_8_21_14_0_10_50_16 TaxID=1975039 RepID=A0A2H0RNL9_9BACT|nr:MAG: signal peptidase I [Candidatus Uhrbacteria bacterium CG10_big_fil_rev_8_21_14_0_10_50_16]